MKNRIRQQCVLFFLLVDTSSLFFVAKKCNNSNSQVVKKGLNGSNS